MIRRELGAFLLVGCLAVLVDFCAYHACLTFAPQHAVFAKAFGFIGGAMFSYVANKAWTFARPQLVPEPGCAERFVVLYGVTLAANVSVNSVALDYFAGLPRASHIAFVLATGTSTVLNFFGLKLLVFKASGSKAAT